MPSEIENERQRIFDQLNGQARLLERHHRALAVELNEKLCELVAWLAVRASQGGSQDSGR
jgi:hypothetical protein